MPRERGWGECLKKSRFGALGLAIACFSCAPESPRDSTQPEAQETGDTGYEAIDVPTLTPTWGPDEVELAFSDVLSSGLPEPVTMRDWLFDLLHIWDGTWADVTCPSTTPTVGEGEVHSTALAGCTGELYALNGGWIYDEELNPENGHLLASGLFTLTGEYTSGVQFSLGGSFYLGSWDDSGSLHNIFKLGGTFEEPTQPGWLGRGVSSGVELEGSVQDGELQSAKLVGALGVGDESFVYFDEVVFDSQNCSGLPRGTVLIRDPSTLWLTMVFPETCSSCATLSYDGAELGEVCMGDALSRAVLDTLSLEPEEVPW